jgi:hypothetical protein
MTLREKIAAEIGNVPASNESCLTIADRVLALVTDEYGLTRNVLDENTDLRLEVTALVQALEKYRRHACKRSLVL